MCPIDLKILFFFLELKSVVLDDYSINSLRNFTHTLKNKRFPILATFPKDVCGLDAVLCGGRMMRK